MKQNMLGSDRHLSIREAQQDHTEDLNQDTHRVHENHDYPTGRISSKMIGVRCLEINPHAAHRW